MPAIFYDENAKSSGAPTVPYEKWNAVKAFLGHFDNFLILTAIVAKPKSLSEKLQAVKEMGICERKMDYWKRHPNYDQIAVTKGCEALKALWRTK